MTVSRRASAAVVLSVLVCAPAGGQDLRLIDAARLRDVHAVVALVERVDVNARQPDGATALHWAAHWNDLELADLLIRAGARANVTNEYGVSPLVMSAMNGSAAMIERLLQAGADADAGLPSGETPLMFAARAGSVEAVALLVAHGANVNVRDAASGQTALMWAAAEGHVDVARALIERGADVQARSTAGFSPLWFAARAGDRATAATLREAGANVNEVAGDGSTALLVATIRGHVALAADLLDHGADPNLAESGYSPLHWVAGTWETTLRFDNKARSSEWAPLTGLKGPAKWDVMKSLLAHGADPNARTTKTPPRFGMTVGAESGIFYQLNGATPFLIAAMAGDAIAMRLLVSSGADPLLGTKERMTPLMQAAGVGRVLGESIVRESQALEAVTVAWELGADVTAVDAFGDTALHGAAREGFDTVVRFLVEKGAAVNVRNLDGETPLIIALGNGTRRAGATTAHPSTANLLRALGGIEETKDLRQRLSDRLRSRN